MNIGSILRSTLSDANWLVNLNKKTLNCVFSGELLGTLKKNVAALNAENRHGDIMKGQRIGYVRVSSADQNPERQLEGTELDRVFTDKASGKDTTQRPQLEALITYVREGDIVIVHSMDRLARNLDDLLYLVQQFTRQGISITFMKENLTFTGEDSPMAKLLLSVMGAVAEFERALIHERQREGIALAKGRGAYRGRKKVLSPEQVAALKHRAEAGEQKAALAREFSISRETLYQYLQSGLKQELPPRGVTHLHQKLML